MTSQVLEGVTFVGGVNTSADELTAHIAHNIRLGHPQVRPQPLQAQEVCIVGGGPSLADTESELVDLVMHGAKVVALNGAAAWCLERNIRPSAQVIMDARPENARFVGRAIPQCRYLLASQCHPDVFQACEGRDVWIWHAETDASDASAVLDAYYLKRWHGVVGGTTVAMRAVILLRMLGYLRMHLFGVDSCWMGDQHHGFSQPENDSDKRIACTVAPSDRPELARTFSCAPWHAKQAEDFLQLIRINGHLFQLAIHGDGMLAYLLRTSADGFTKE